MKRNEKEVVARFFEEGYEQRNYAAVMELVAEDYLDHSPAGARSNAQAVEILKIVSGQYPVCKLTMLHLFGEGELVATRVRYEMQTQDGRRLCFDALENFRVRDGKIQESWGYWPDKQIEQMLQG